MPSRNFPDPSGGLPDTNFFNPQDLVRAQQRLGFKRLDARDPDRGLFAVGTLMLAGIAGWAGLRHFGKDRVRGVVGQIKNLLSNPKKFGFPEGELKKLKDAVRQISDTVAKQPWAHVHQDRLGMVLGQSRAATDPTILNTLTTLREHLKRDPRWGATAADAAEAVSSRYRMPIPQDATGMRRLRMGDLFDAAGGGQHTSIFHGVKPTKQLGQVQNILRDIQTNIPGLKINQNLANMVVDPGLFVHQSRGGVNRLVNLSAVHPGNLIRSLGDRAMKGRAMAAGGAPWYRANAGSRLAHWALELMAPTELMGTGPAAFIGTPGIAGGLLPKGTQLSGMTGSLFLGGSVHPLYGATGEVGPAIASGLVAGRAATRMGMMARVRGRTLSVASQMAEGVMPADAYAAERGIAVGSARHLALQAGDKLGVGPQYSLRGMGIVSDVASESLLENAINLIRDPRKTANQIFAHITRGRAPSELKELADPYFAVKPLQGIKDYANFLLHRVGHLLTSTTSFKGSEVFEKGAAGIAGRLANIDFPGLGIRPAAGPGGTLARWAMLGAAGWAGINAVSYVDYHARSLTGTGPVTAPLQAYTAARVAGQAAYAGIGVQQTSAYLENLMPGLIESPASRMGRALAVGRWLGPKVGGALGVGATAGQLITGALTATQLTDITQTPGNLAAVYRGDVDIPVRAGRGWALGTQPFGGGRIQYYRPHAIAQYMSGGRDAAIYGSEGAAWGNNLFPTPESLFGLRPLLDPYAVERRHYLTRPYPQTSPMFGEVPIVGPLLAATVGEVIKPTQRWHADYWGGGGVKEPGMPFASPYGAAETLGYKGIGGQPRQRVGDPSRPFEVLGKQIDIMRDFLGMPGFLLGALKRQVTGEEDFNVSTRHIATSGRITSAARQYYDAEVGGLLGFTELFRRFLPHRRRQIELVNPIPNQMPGWLPGSFSEFPRDRMAWENLHRGDPYAAIPYGETRLPGPGYEALHRLHSGIPGVYDPYDRWKILRDIAPNSQAFQHYDAIVQGWARGSAIANRSGGKWLEGQIGSPFKAIVRRVIDGDTVIVDLEGKLTTVRLFGGDAPEIAHGSFEASLSDSIGGQIAKKRLERSVLGQTVTLNPVSFNPPSTEFESGRLVAEMQLGGRNISAELEAAYPSSNLTFAQQALTLNTRRDIEQRYQPYPFTERIFDKPFATVPRAMRDLTSRSLGAINTAIKEQGEFSLPEKLIGRAWEGVSHVQLPGPLNWPVNKLFPQRTATEYYRMRQLGAGFANWSTPVKSFIAPWVNQALGTAFPGYIPSEVRAQQAATENLDMLQYVKMQRLSGRARMAGAGSLANFYNAESSRTMTGSIISGNRRFVRGALPRRERSFYTPFIRERSPERRQEILQMVPPMFGTMLRQAWGGDVGAERAAVRGAASEISAMAPNDWAGWHPDVPLHLMKVRVADNEGWDFHDLGMANRERYLAEDLFSNYMSSLEAPATFNSRIRGSAYMHANSLQLDNMQVRVTDSWGPSSTHISIGRDKRRRNRLFDMWDSPEMMGNRF